MSALTTPDAWKEMCQLLESRKQVLDNALIRTLDDKCSASHFQVVRNLLLDHEKFLLWFYAQQAANPGQERPLPVSTTITRPVSSPLTSTTKRAGFIKPALIALLAIIFFSVLVLLAICNGRHFNWPKYDQNAEIPHKSDRIPLLAAHGLLPLECIFLPTRKCCIMEHNHVSECQTALPSEMDHAPSSTRSPCPYQICIASCDQDFPHPA